MSRPKITHFALHTAARRPAGICKTMYPQKNMPVAKPIAEALIPSSPRMAGIAIAMLDERDAKDAHPAASVWCEQMLAGQVRFPPLPPAVQVPVLRARANDKSGFRCSARFRVNGLGAGNR
jgi:hypothetical protein